MPQGDVDAGDYATALRAKWQGNVIGGAVLHP